MRCLLQFSTKQSSVSCCILVPFFFFFLPKVTGRNKMMFALHIFFLCAFSQQFQDVVSYFTDLDSVQCDLSCSSQFEQGVSVQSECKHTGFSLLNRNVFAQSVPGSQCLLFFGRQVGMCFNLFTYCKVCLDRSVV